MTDESSHAKPLAERRCTPCEGGVAPLTREQAESLLATLPGWRLTEDGRRIRKEWKARDFLDAMEYLRRAAEVAEAEQHHPDLHLTSYRQVAVEIWTHAIGGLSENDFILAAKLDRAAGS